MLFALTTPHCFAMRQTARPCCLRCTTNPAGNEMSVGEHFLRKGDNVATRVLREGRIGPDRRRRQGMGRGRGEFYRTQPFPPDTEARLTDFAKLVAMAIANAQAQSDLTASRTRIVTAADDARRRLERDLHDGAQQRLVSLALKARMTELSLPAGQDEIREQLSRHRAGPWRCVRGAASDLSRHPSGDPVQGWARPGAAIAGVPLGGARRPRRRRSRPAARPGGGRRLLRCGRSAYQTARHAHAARSR